MSGKWDQFFEACEVPEKDRAKMQRLMEAEQERIQKSIEELAAVGAEDFKKIRLPVLGSTKSDPHCARCGSFDVFVGYSCPPYYRCQSCGKEWEGQGIRVLPQEDAESKRPVLYGKPVCAHCPHAPHPDGDCRWCKEEG